MALKGMSWLTGSTKRAVIGAGLLGIAAGIAGIYGMSLVEGNESAAACTGAERLADMRPLAQGEVAAFVVAERAEPLADLVFRDGEGGARALSDWQGRTVLLNLWATWCAPCREEMPALDALEADLGGEDFQVVAVSIDREAEQAADFLSEIGIETLGLYTDTTSGVFRQLRQAGLAFGMPTTLIVDEAGCQLGQMAGPADWNSPDAQALVRAAKGG